MPSASADAFWSVNACMQQQIDTTILAVRVVDAVSCCPREVIMTKHKKTAEASPVAVACMQQQQQPVALMADS